MKQENALQSDMQDIQTPLRRLQGIGRILYAAAAVTNICVWAALAYCTALLGLLLAGQPLGDKLVQQGPFSPILESLTEIPGVATVALHEQHLIAVFTAMLTLGVLLIALRFMRELLRDITTGDNPFHQQNAKRLQGLAVLFLLVFFWNPPLGVLIFALGMSTSYLFRYGAALYARASETIKTQESVILAFAEMVEAKSGQTGQHVKRVSEYSRVLGAQLGLDAQQVETLRVASMMHDVGKLFTPPEILEKPGRLTAEEFAVIKRHVTDGEQLLHSAEGEVMQTARRIALEHHERWDGKGYLGRSGEAIDRCARIVAVADVFDALTTRRPYKAPWPPEQAKQEILAGAATQFDPTVTAAFAAAWPQIQQILERYRDQPPPQAAMGGQTA